LELSQGVITALEERTEGWITGLQLAGLWVRGRRTDSSAVSGEGSEFLTSFTGSHRYVLDYLTEEVLRRQPEAVRTFLLRTSILDRLSGPLCDALTKIAEPVDDGAASPGSPGSFVDGQAVLEHLEDHNLFVVPLDGERRWYRYHRLFADLLRARLQGGNPGLARALHRAASRWLGDHGMPSEAMRHGLAAEDLDLAVHIAETHGRDLLLRGELYTLRRWIEALPLERVHASPRLCATQAWTLLLVGYASAVEPWLQQVEALVDPDDPLLGDVAAVRAYANSQRGDAARTMALAETALRRLPASKLGERAVVYFVLGGAHLLQGNVAGARAAFTRAVSLGRKGGNLHLALPAYNSLTGIEMNLGALRQAQATAQEALDLVTGPRDRPLPIGAGSLSSLAELAYEWNDLETALEQAHEAVELANLWGNADTIAFGYLTLAEILIALGRFEQARDIFRKAESYSGEVMLFPSFASAMQAALAKQWIAKPDLDTASRWAESTEACVQGVLDLGRVFRLAQVHQITRRPEAASTVLDGLLAFASSKNLTPWVIRGKALRALVWAGEGSPAEALTMLEETLAHAEPEGYVRSFVDLGPELGDLIQEIARTRASSRYLRRLVKAFEAPVGEESTTMSREQPLIEPLSDRELEVLGLVAEGLTNREVGQRLHIAESTVKSHLNSVYGKLAVDNRTQAAAKARDLNLLSPTL
jgi:LuxR family maltose regulon positive regulatory protein